jgi:PAS domain S-box-containing protein
VIEELERLKRRLEREIKARKQAETTLEIKSRELYNSNEALQQMNNELEMQVSFRSSALITSETRYRQLVENATDIIFNISKEGRFTFINKLGINALGYREEEVIGALFVHFIPSNYMEYVTSHYTKVLEQALEKDYFEFPVLKKSGEILWVGQNFNRVIAADGVVYYSSITRDINQRKRTEIELEKSQKALEKSEVKYRSIIENMELGLLEVDTKGVIIRVYNRFNEMTGYSGNELVGKSAIEELAVPSSEATALEQIAARNRGVSGVYEIEIRKKNGSTIWVMVSGAPFYNEKGEVLGSIGIHYNITERKRLEADLENAKKKAEDAQRAGEFFLASMSHEIRTPLNAIIGMSHLLEETPLKSDQEEYLKIMQSSADLLKYLISDILDISKIDSANFDLILIPLNIEEVCSEIIKTFRYKNINPQTSWFFTLENSIEYCLLADRNRLTQVLINLLANSEKFTVKGSIQLKVSTEQISSDLAAVTFEVIDTGIGIPSENLLQIFDPFKQANTAITQQYGGTGLGLPISEKLVQLMGGDLRVESREGEGSKFSFTLKLTIDKTLNVNSVKSTKKSERIPNGKGKRILIVEDNQMNVKYVSVLLQKWGFDYDVAYNGKEAIEAFKTGVVYDLILMDVQMPLMDGLTATKAIRKLEHGKTIPLILLTASSYISRREIALNEGITDFLSKPFSPTDFFYKLNTYFSFPQIQQANTNDFQYCSKLDGSYLEAAYGSAYIHALEMMELFVKMIPDSILILNKEVEEGDTIAIRATVHRLNPTFSMVGLSSLTELARKIELHAEEKELLAVKLEVALLIEAINNNIHYIRTEIKRLKTHLNI